MTLIWSLMCCLSLLAPGDEEPARPPRPPTTTATIQQAAQPIETIRAWLNDLNADSAELRKAARNNLLNMSRADLMTLKKLVSQGEARQPAQKQALREIVSHVFLATDPYDCDPRTSFFGLLTPRTLAVGDRVGLIFNARLIGFPAYVSVEDGDIVMAVEEMPEIDFAAEGKPLDKVREKYPPGSIVHLQVLRDDRMLSIPVMLAATPVWPTNGQEERVIREQKAAEYWRREFEPLLTPPPQ